MSKSLKHASFATICLIGIGTWIIFRATNADRDSTRGSWTWSTHSNKARDF